MSHHKHTTEAFILNVIPSREHDARVKMVTRDGEVLTAIAAGLRMLKSKLRMAVVPFAHATVSIVKGKDVWRLTNAQPIRNFYEEIKGAEARKALAKTVSLVERLTPGETHIGNVFEILLAYAGQLITQATIKTLEIQAALNILSELGHIEERERWGQADLAFIEAHMKEAVEVINHGIASTHLA